MLKHVQSKAYAAELRAAAIPQLRALASDTQFAAGLNGAGTEMAHLYLRAACDYAAIHRRSTCILYVDVHSAFPSMLRDIVLPLPESDEELFARISRSAMVPDVAIAVAEAIRDQRMWAEEPEGSEHLEALLMAAHSST